MRAVSVVAACLLAQSVSAQTVTVKVSGGDILSIAEYSPECQLSPKYVEGDGPLVDVTELYYDNPHDTSQDCRVLLWDLVSGLPAGVYRAAISFGGAYGPLSTPFTRTAPPPLPPEGCWDGPTFVSVGTVRVWQWKPTEVKARMTALGPAWVDWRTTKANKNWQWQEARCAG